jgi:two-component system response regulator YesN
MVSLLIAEDDELERNGLLSSIHWDEMGITIVGTADDGNRAFEMVERFSPDILITDIRMPIMDGIELARRTKELFPETKIIFVTGFDDFDYALAAIKFNISDYILKPYNTDIDKIEGSIKKIALECLSEKKKKREERILRETLNEHKPLLVEKFFRDVLTGVEMDDGRIENRIRFLQLNIDEEALLLALIQTEEPDIAGGSGDELGRQVTEISIVELLVEHLASFRYVKVLVWRSQEFIAIINDCITKLSDKQEINKTLNRIGSVLKMDYGIIATIGVSNVASNIKCLNSCYKEASEAVRHKFHLGRDKVIFYDDIKISERSSFPETGEMIRALIMAVEVGNTDDISHNLTSIFDEFQHCQGISLHYVQNVSAGILLQTIKTLMEMNLYANVMFEDTSTSLGRLMSLKTIPDIQSCLAESIDRLTEQVNENNKKRITNIIIAVKKAIHENYMNDITIESIASTVYLSPNYLNMIFKKNTGKSINKYLIEFRMNKAKEMLDKPDSTISGTSESVGYSNVAHFSTLFKKYTNLTPMEYREKKYLKE